MNPVARLMALASLMLSMAVGAQPTLTLCYENADIAPWRQADGSGLNFDLLRRVATRLDLQLVFVGLPWKRCLAELKSNRVHGAFAASFVAERLALGAYPGGSVPAVDQRLYQDRYVLLRRRGEPVGWDGKALANLSGAVGCQLGYSVCGQLRALGATVDEGGVDVRALLLKLLAGRLQAVALGGSDVATLLGHQPEVAQQLEVLAPPLAEKAYYLLLSHELLATQPALTQQIWQTIAVVRRSAEYRKLEQQAVAAKAH